MPCSGPNIATSFNPSAFLNSVDVGARCSSALEGLAMRPTALPASDLKSSSRQHVDAELHLGGLADAAGAASVTRAIRQ
jgi:hypothetical protein